jgi:hypothetical protein
LPVQVKSPQQINFSFDVMHKVRTRLDKPAVRPAPSSCAVCAFVCG